MAVDMTKRGGKHRAPEPTPQREGIAALMHALVVTTVVRLP